MFSNPFTKRLGRRCGPLLLSGLLALSGCAALDAPLDPRGAPPNARWPVSRADLVARALGHAPELARALPFMGFPAAAERGLTGTGTTISVIDLFGGRDDWGSAHGWAVLESVQRAAPGAATVAVDLAKIAPAAPLGALAAAEALELELTAPDRADVVTLSLTWRRPGCDYAAEAGTLWMKLLIDRLVAAGTVVVAAAGNHGAEEARFPACLPQVVAAGSAYDRTFLGPRRWPGNPDKGRPACADDPALKGMKTCFSNPGDLYAPGDLDGYARARVEAFQGTSASAPLVAAALAVMRQAGYGPGEAVIRLKATARKRHGVPVVDLAAALADVPLSAYDRGR